MKTINTNIVYKPMKDFRELMSFLIKIPKRSSTVNKVFTLEVQFIPYLKWQRYSVTAQSNTFLNAVAFEHLE